MSAKSHDNYQMKSIKFKALLNGGSRWELIASFAKETTDFNTFQENH